MSVVPDRPGGYNADKIWGYDPISATYKWLDANTNLPSGGERYETRLVVVGHKVIYYGSL
jgi:hypothetical protein